MKKRKIVTIIIILAVAIAVGIGSVVAYNAVTTNRTGLVLDLDFGNNDGASAPTVYDTSGNGYNALSVAPSQAPIPYDDYCDFVWGDFIRVSHELFNTAETSIAFKFSPDFEAGDNDEHPLFTGTGYYINKTSSNALYVAFGSSGIHNVSLANYQAYWNVGEENVLVITGTTGNNDLWLNGVKIDETTTAWTQSNPAQIQIGISLTGTKFFDGKMYYMKVWNRLLTDNEVATLSADRTTHVSAPPASGLIGHWNMDSNDISGTTVYDKSGNGNNGTITGATSVEGKIKEALNFTTGGSNNVNFGNDAILNPSTQITVSAWVKPSILTGNQPLLFKSINEYYIWLTVGGSIQMVTKGLSDEIMSLSSSLLTLNDWNYLTFTYNGAIKKIYLNGTEITSENATGNITTGANDLILGYFATAMGGAIDELRIYNRALPIEEITALYNATKMNYISTVDESDTTLNLNFGNNDGASAPTIYDTSGNGHNATSTAGATAPTCNDNYCTFGNADRTLSTATGVFNSPEISIAIKFKPQLELGTGNLQYLFDTSNLSRYTVAIDANNDYDMYILLGSASLPRIPLATYQPYWNDLGENILIISSSATTDRTDVYLNGYKILDQDATTWAEADPAVLYMGILYTQSSWWAYSDIYYFKVWDRLLTSDEVATLSADRKNYIR